MKPNKEFRGKGIVTDPEDVIKKAVKLTPIKKSGKDKHMLYGRYDDDEEDLDLDYRKRESVLDYFDDGEEESEEDR